MKGFIAPYNIATYLQNPSCTSSIDTIATGSDIPEFPITHIQPGENFSLYAMFSWPKESFKASMQPQKRSECKYSNDELQQQRVDFLPMSLFHKDCCEIASALAFHNVGHARKGAYHL